MNGQPENVWSLLLTAGLVHGDKPESGEPDSPWYVKLLLAISGWLASLFLLVFLGVGLAFVFRDMAPLLTAGIVMIGGAYALLRIPKNAFFEHVALAVSLEGQALVVLAIFVYSPESINWVLVTVFQLVLAMAVPNFVHRVFCSFFAASCFSIALISIGLPYIASSIMMAMVAWLWLYEFRYPRHMEKQRAIGYGLVLALIQIKGTALFGVNVIDLFSGSADLNMGVQLWWVSEILLAAVTVYVVWYILKQLGRDLFEPTSIASLLGTILLIIVSAEAQSIAVGMLILLLGFAGSNRVLMGLGIGSLLFYISSYYYLLDYTLLEKSLTLLILGVVLLAAKFIVQK